MSKSGTETVDEYSDESQISVSGSDSVNGFSIESRERVKVPDDGSIKSSSGSESARQVEEESFNFSRATKSTTSKSKNDENVEKITKKLQPKRSRHKIAKSQNVLGVKLLESSSLKFKKHIRMPRVRISLYDQSTSKLVKKSRADKNVIFNKEPDSLDFILPIISTEGKMFNEFFFLWNELIIINDDLEYLQNPNFLMFFEIIDIVREPAKFKSHRKVYGGWYHICWAFMRLGQHETKTTLQLYKYKKASKNHPVFKQWVLSAFKKYPATLEVQLLGILPKMEEVALSRPLTAFQIDRKTPWPPDNSNQNNELPISTWTEARKVIRRKFFQPPEKVLFETQTQGSSTVCSFSTDGKFVAYTDNATRLPTVVVRKSTNFSYCLNLRGHTDLIHSLEWWDTMDSSSKLLISTSQDKSCIVWQIEEDFYSIQFVLPHTCFLYCAVLASSCSGRAAQIATGGRDTVLYIWNVSSKNPRIHQELQEHNSYIIGVGYSSTLGTLFSADVRGGVVEWKYETESWTAGRKFDLKKTIKQFTLHPHMSNIYILLEESLVKMDARSGTQLQVLLNQVVGLSPNKFAISQNGAHLFLVSQLNVLGFNQFSEELVCKIRLKRDQDGINDVNFHSNNNLLAISTQSKLLGGGFFVYGPNEPEIIQKVSMKRNNPTMEGLSLENSSFSEILNKLDRILRIGKVPSAANVPEPLEEVSKERDLQTYSIRANHTFVIQKESDNSSSSKEENNFGHTFVKESSTNSDTDISDDMPNSEEQESSSAHKTNRTIIICKEAT